MNINLPYKKAAENMESNAQTTINIIQGAIATAHKDGFDGTSPYRRMYARLQAKFDNAVEQNSSELTLDETEKDFIIKALRTASLPVAWSLYVVLIEDELEKK